MQLRRRLLGPLLGKVTRPLEVEEGVYQLRAVGSRVTAILGAEGVLLVDAGGHGSLALIESGLRRLGASLQDVRLIVLTHTHPDHAGGLAAVAGATGAPVAVHADEADYLTGETEPESPFHHRLLQKVARPFVAALSGGRVDVTTRLVDDDRLTWKEEVRVIHTPGHTPGSISLYVPSRRLLIPGDAMQFRFHRLSAPATFVTADPALARDSLAKLAKLEIGTVSFSHFSSLHADPSAELRRLARRGRRIPPEGLVQ